MTSSDTLISRLSKMISVWILTLLALVTLSILILTYVSSFQMYKKQANAWVLAFPQYTVPHLIDSDDFATSQNVRFMESTGLFSGFLVTDNQKRVIAKFGTTPDSQENFLTITDGAGVIWGYYAYQTNFEDFLRPFIYYGLVCLFLMMCLSYFVRKKLKKSLGHEFDSFNAFLSNIELITKAIHTSESHFSPPELQSNLTSTTQEQARIHQAISLLIKEIQNSHLRLKEMILESEKRKTQDEVSKIALQVAHDIRSPLMALETIMSDTREIPEERRTILIAAIGRIRDISNSLFSKNQKLNTNTNTQSTVLLLSSAMDTIVSEKRIQFRDLIGIEIINNLDSDSYGLFAKVEPVTFQRVLSNIIDNATEASGDSGYITVSLSTSKEGHLITVTDKGKGIPEEILPLLMKQGATFGKTSGSGLGLYHAKESITSWGGTLSISSKMDEGTAVSILLPASEPPKWFVDKLQIPSHSVVVVIDDDASIHHVWRERFELEEYKKFAIKLLHHSNPGQVREWYQTSQSQEKACFFLVDYEFLGRSETGLDLIEELGIAGKSILVTSRYEDSSIRNRCKEYGIRLIPKGMAGYVPIELFFTPQAPSPIAREVLDENSVQSP